MKINRKCEFFNRSGKYNQSEKTDKKDKACVELISLDCTMIFVNLNKKM